MIHNNSFEIKNYIKINLGKSYDKSNLILDKKNNYSIQNNYSNKIGKIVEVEENESNIYNENESENIISKEKNYFNNLIKSRRNSINSVQIFDDNKENGNKKRLFQFLQQNFNDSENKEKFDFEKKIGFSMENFYNKNNDINNNTNNFPNRKINKKCRCETIFLFSNINNNKNNIVINNPIKNKNKYYINDNIQNIKKNNYKNNISKNYQKDLINNNDISNDISLTNPNINNKLYFSTVKERFKNNNIFSLNKDIMDNLRLNRKSFSYINNKNILSKFNLKLKNNLNENENYRIKKKGKADTVLKTKQSIELTRARDNINDNYIEYKKKYKKRKSVDYIYLNNNFNGNEEIIEETIEENIENNLNKIRKKKRFSLDNTKNHNNILVNLDNLKQKNTLNKKTNKAKIKSKKKKKKKVKNKVGNKSHDNKEEPIDNIITNNNLINKNEKLSIFYLDSITINRPNKKLYQFNKQLDFLNNISTKTREEIEKEEEIKRQHETNAYNILRQNQLNNLVKIKRRKSVSFNQKKLFKKFRNKNSSKERKTPPNFKRRRTQVLNSEKYISNLLKKQLVYDNSYLFQNEQKPKIYKNYEDVISLIPEEERDNIIIEDIKDNKFKDNKNEASNDHESKKGNIGKNKKINSISRNKIKEEINKDEEEELPSFMRQSKFIRRKKSKSFPKNVLMSKFMNNNEENNELNNKENENERKEKLLMEKLYSFFNRIQKLKNSNDNEVDEFINEDLEKKGINERRQRFLRLNSFIDDINYMKNYDKFFKSKIKYLSPLCFSSPSIFKKE